jgi:sterol 3beta-glucosyltransferase
VAVYTRPNDRPTSKMDPMHVLMVTTGTLGDVHPFVALGLGLKRAGYRVTLATHPEYETLASERGLAFRRVGVSFKELLESPAGRNWIESGESLRRYKEAMARAFLPSTPQWLADVHAATLDADAILFQPFAVAAYHTAEKRGIPALCVSPFPVVVSSELEPLVWPKAPRWRWLRRRLSDSLGKVTASVFGEHHNAHRRKLGLAPWHSANPFAELLSKIPTLHVYSPSLLPAPSDWGPLAQVTGFCSLAVAADWRPPPELTRFLENGPPPIYLGFGSMTGRYPEQLARLSIDAITRTKHRAVLASGWSGMGQGVELPDSIYRVDSVPHDWLFPRVSAVVHHGGAGTTAAGLRAGKPTLVTAFFGDQRFWGARVEQAGAGPAPIARRGLDARTLADGIARTLGDPRYQLGANRIAESLSREDGVANAVAAFARHAGAASTSGPV